MDAGDEVNSTADAEEAVAAWGLGELEQLSVLDSVRPSRGRADSADA